MKQVEAAVDVLNDGLKASGASDFQPGGLTPVQPDVVDLLVLAVMLLDQLRTPGSLQRTFLLKVGAEIDRARSKLLLEIDRVES